MKNILITGGGGFIGKNLIKYINSKENVKFIIIDNFVSSDKSEFNYFLKSINLFNTKYMCVYEYDIIDNSIFKLIEPCIDEIYHLASIASPKIYKENPLKTLDVGYIGTKNVLEFAKKNKSKVLFSSTSEVYGDANINPQKEDYYGNVNSFGVRSCYSDDTEILTEDGYKLFSDLNYNDKVATLNSNNKLEYNIPDEIIKERYVGNMYEFKNLNIELNVTPNHKMYVKKQNYNQFELLPAESKISWDRAVLKKTCNYIGKKQEWFYFPENFRELTNQKTPFVEKVNMDVWLEFMGYYLSKGHTECGIFKVQISQSETVKPLYFEKIKQCLDKMPFHYDISRSGNSYFVISNKQLAHYLIRFGKSKDKFIPSDLLSLSKPQLVILLDALMLGDGTYFSSSYKLMSGIQELLLKIGTFGNILKENRTDENNTANQMYYMTINSNPGRDYTYTNPIINNYNGYVYCVNVKNHIIFVRRNGKAVFCGNCYDESKRAAETLCFTYITEYKLDIKIARIFNTYGPGMLLDDGRIITECIKHIANDSIMNIYGGKQTRSYSYIDDTIEMLYRLMNSNFNSPINIGNDVEISVNKTINIIEKIYKKKIKKNYVKMTQNDPKQRRPDLTLNKQILGTINYTKFEDGIKKMMEFYKNI